MNEIAIFKNITTEDALLDLEATAEKYEGLYCDLSNDDERRFVKNQASAIDKILKMLDRSRIDKAKEFKVLVENEASYIRDRLENANKPFTLLIDKWNEERKRILDAKKKEEELRQRANDLANDHEEALMMNKVFDFEKKERLEKERDELERIKKEAAAQAKFQAEMAAQKAIDDAKKQSEISEEKRLQAIKDAEIAQHKAALEAEARVAEEAQRVKRELEEKKRTEEYQKKRLEDIELKKSMDIEHRISINSKLLGDFILRGVDEKIAKKLIHDIANNIIENISINY